MGGWGLRIKRIRYSVTVEEIAHQSHITDSSIAAAYIYNIYNYFVTPNTLFSIHE